MRSLEENKAEIFRRAQERIQKQRRRTRRVLAIGLPLMLSLGVVGLLLAGGKGTGAEPERVEEFTQGSYVCTYVRAEIHTAEKTWTVTDKAEVTQIFNAVFEEGEKSQEPQMGENNLGTQEQVAYRIVLYNEDGSFREYCVPEEQWEYFGLDMEE